MATLAELSVIIGANISDLDRKLSQVQSKLAKTGAQMKDVGKTMSLSLTAPIVLFGVSALKAAGDFEAGMNNVQALTGATGKEFETLTNQAKELGATTQFSASEAADGMGFLAQAGFDANKILGAMPGTLNLAAAASLGLGESADIVSNIMSGFGLEAEDLNGAVDILTKQFTTSNTNLQQLGEAMKFVGPVASALGISMAETAAAIGALSDAGMQGSMAGTGFRKILSTLILKSKDLGLKIKDANGQMLPFVDILEQMEKQGISTEKVMETFGERGGPALLNLLSKGSRAIREQTALLQEAGGTAEEIAKTKMKGLNGALKALASAFEGVQLAIADSGILEFFTDFVTGIAETLREIAKTNPAMLKMGVVIAGVVAAAGPLIFILGTMATAVAAISAPVLLVAGGLAALAIGMGAIATSGDRATGAFEAQKQKVDSLESSLSPLIDRHDELTEKSKLTKDEQIELDKIIQAIAKSVPTAVTEFDKFGKALGISTKAAKNFIQEQKNILALKNVEAIDENIAALSDLKNEYDLLTGGVKRINGELVRQEVNISKTGKATIINTALTNDEIVALQSRKKALTDEVKTRLAIIAGLRGERSEAEKLAALKSQEPVVPEPPTGAVTPTPTGGAAVDISPTLDKNRVAFNKFAQDALKNIDAVFLGFETLKDDGIKPFVQELEFARAAARELSAAFDETPIQILERQRAAVKEYIDTLVAGGAPITEAVQLQIDEYNRLGLVIDEMVIKQQEMKEIAESIVELR